MAFPPSTQVVLRFTNGRTAKCLIESARRPRATCLTGGNGLNGRKSTDRREDWNIMIEIPPEDRKRAERRLYAMGVRRWEEVEREIADSGMAICGFCQGRGFIYAVGEESRTKMVEDLVIQTMLGPGAIRLKLVEYILKCPRCKGLGWLAAPTH